MLFQVLFIASISHLFFVFFIAMAVLCESVTTDRVNGLLLQQLPHPKVPSRGCSVVQP